MSILFFLSSVNNPLPFAYVFISFDLCIPYYHITVLSLFMCLYDKQERKIVKHTTTEVVGKGIYSISVYLHIQYVCEYKTTFCIPAATSVIHRHECIFFLQFTKIIVQLQPVLYANLYYDTKQKATWRYNRQMQFIYLSIRPSIYPTNRPTYSCIYLFIHCISLHIFPYKSMQSAVNWTYFVDFELH